MHDIQRKTDKAGDCTCIDEYLANCDTAFRFAFRHEPNAEAPNAEVIRNDVKRAVKESDLTEKGIEDRKTDESAVAKGECKLIDLLFVDILDTGKEDKGKRDRQRMRKDTKAKHEKPVFEIQRGKIELGDGINDEKGLCDLDNDGGKSFCEVSIDDLCFSCDKADENQQKQA